MTMDRPIGMFDSGFGGLTVARAVIDLLPHEHLVYIGDTGRYPYGPRPLAEVRGFAHQLAWSLVKEFDVKAVVVACNTAAAAALHELERELPVPVIDVVAPGTRALVRATSTGRVGVIGTVGTISSGAYQREVASRDLDGSVTGGDRMGVGVDVVLTAAACPGFVEFVERGQTSGPEIEILAERLLAPVKEADVDALLLGCTHYPYLAEVIAGVMGAQVTLVNSADETARVVRDVLAGSGLLRDAAAAAAEPAEHRFLSSGDISWFADLGGRLLGPELRDAEQWHHDTAPGIPRRTPPDSPHDTAHCIPHDTPEDPCHDPS
jgi:glutamate racemase